MERKYGIVYILRCRCSGKCYIGQTTKTVQQRIIDHRHNKYVIGKAIRKYGIESFDIFQYSFIPVDMLDYCEMELIKRLNTVIPNGYNIMLGGQKNRVMNEESIKKLSKSLMGRTVWNKGIPMRPEAKEKMIKAKTGQKPSEETKRKMSESAKKVVHTEEWNKNVSLAQRGKRITEEQKEKIRQKLIGIKQSEERKKLQSQTMKDWWAKRKANQGG